MSIFTSHDTKTPLEAARNKVKTASMLGYQALQEANYSAWESFWEMSDVIIEGDTEAQISLRHALYQLRIAASDKNEHVSIGAKTLSGFGYRGHIFWDNEIFVLPFFTFTQPALARNMLMYRWHTLPGARRKAIENGYAGAQYAWESAETGDEVTPALLPHFSERGKLVRIWTGDIQIHICSDIAYALHQYWQITGDTDFWKDVGIQILLETAIFWGERAEFKEGCYSIRDIMGPDEYHDHVDNNVFTNRMVQWHLETAIDALNWLKEHAPQKAIQLIEKFELTSEKLAHWQNVKDGLVILFDSNSNVFEQFEGFNQLNEIDWSKYKDRVDSMQFLLGIEETNRHKVIKQADVIMLLCLLREQYDTKIWQANWDYYSPITDHTYGSSLSPAMHSWAACELGKPDLAYEHFLRAARADFLNIRGNADDGIHAASAGGLWQAAIFGFGGLYIEDSIPKIKPRLPSHWQRLAFNFLYHGQVYRFDIQNDTT